MSGTLGCEGPHIFFLPWLQFTSNLMCCKLMSLKGHAKSLFFHPLFSTECFTPKPLPQPPQPPPPSQHYLLNPIPYFKNTLGYEYYKLLRIYSDLISFPFLWCSNKQTYLKQPDNDIFSLNIIVSLLTKITELYHLLKLSLLKMFLLSLFKE